MTQKYLEINLKFIINEYDIGKNLNDIFSDGKFRS